MAKVNGSLLLTVEGMELAHVEERNRDTVVADFHRMKMRAERQHDRFYALKDLFSHRFSYGDFYSDFLFRPWQEFHSDKILSCISQNTHQLIQSFSQCIMLEPLGCEAELRGKEEPHAHTGYCNPQGYEDFVGNKKDWEEWHRRWYCCNPQMIDWSKTENDWLPRQDLIIEILKRELLTRFIEDGNNHEDAKRKLAQISDDSIVHEFHKQVMAHKGSNLEGYALQVGDEICLCNYYKYEAVLSDMERQYAKSLRAIYSVVNRYGRTQFISIDFGHGMFEFHDENGNHLGEFRFDGTRNSAAEANHSLKSIYQWRKQIGR